METEGRLQRVESQLAEQHRELEVIRESQSEMEDKLAGKSQMISTKP